MRPALALLNRLDPERAHHLALRALSAGLVPGRGGPVTSDRLEGTAGGVEMPNPVGLAAGFDKNAVALRALTRAGFGFVEVGAATPRAQEGNLPPRLWRLPEDRAIINRFGFNNEGAAAIAARLAPRPPGPVPVGLNLGANKDSPDRAADFAAVLAEAGRHADFVTVNVSSPNTERLRDLQGPAALEALLAGVLAARDALPRRVPVWLKISPDLDEAGLADLAAVAVNLRLDAIVATNTTLSRDGIASPHRVQQGGLSGRPLRDRAQAVMVRLAAATGGRIDLIGVGGIASVQDAWDRIAAGASAVQLYTALIYDGLDLAARIAEGLDARLAAEGLTLAELRGRGR